MSVASRVYILCVLLNSCTGSLIQYLYSYGTSLLGAQVFEHQLINRDFSWLKQGSINKTKSNNIGNFCTSTWTGACSSLPWCLTKLQCNEVQNFAYNLQRAWKSSDLLSVGTLSAFMLLNRVMHGILFLGQLGGLPKNSSGSHCNNHFQKVVVEEWEPHHSWCLVSLTI